MSREPIRSAALAEGFWRRGRSQRGDRPIGAGCKIGIAIGLNGLLVAVQRLDQRWLVAVGHWGSRH